MPLGIQPCYLYCDIMWYFSQFNPNKLRRHTVSVDNLDDIDNMSDDEYLEDDDDIEMGADGAVAGMLVLLHWEM